MMLDTILGWNGMRVLNLALAMSTVILLTMGAVARWPIMPVSLRRLVPWLIATYMVIAYGSGEALINDVRPGMRVVLMCLSLIGLVTALLYNMAHPDHYAPPPQGAGFHRPRDRTK